LVLKFPCIFRAPTWVPEGGQPPSDLPFASFPLWRVPTLNFPPTAFYPGNLPWFPATTPRASSSSGYFSPLFECTSPQPPQSFPSQHDLLTAGLPLGPSLRRSPSPLLVFPSRIRFFFFFQRHRFMVARLHLPLFSAREDPPSLSADWMSLSGPYACGRVESPLIPQELLFLRCRVESLFFFVKPAFSWS